MIRKFVCIACGTEHLPVQQYSTASVVANGGTACADETTHVKSFSLQTNHSTLQTLFVLLQEPHSKCKWPLQPLLQEDVEDHTISTPIIRAI